MIYLNKTAKQQPGKEERWMGSTDGKEEYRHQHNVKWFGSYN